MNKKKSVYIIIAVFAAVLVAAFGIFYAFSKNSGTQNEKSKNGTLQTDEKKNLSQGETDLTVGDKKTEALPDDGKDGQPPVKNIPDTSELGELIEKFNTMEDGEEKEEVRKQLEDILSYAEEQAEKLK